MPQHAEQSDHNVQYMMMSAFLPPSTPVEHVIEEDRSTLYTDGVVISYANGSYVIQLRRVCASL